MKAILIILITFTISTWSQSFVVNKDTIHFYSGNLIWKTSTDNGSTWSINIEFIFGDKAINFAPICKDNYVYYQSNKTKSLMVSSDYGKTFQEAKIDTSNDNSIKNINDLQISQILFDNNEVYFATNRGLYISYDKGYTLLGKNNPGQIMVLNNGNLDNPEEAGLSFGFSNAIHSIEIVESSLFLTSNDSDGGIFQTIKYNKNDSKRTLCYPTSKDYFISKYGSGSYFWDVSSYSLTKVNNKIYTILAKRNNTDEYAKVWTMNPDGSNLTEQDYSAYGIEHPTWIASCGDILYLYDNGINIDIKSNGKKLFMSTDQGQTWQYINAGIDAQTGVETEYSYIFEDMQFNDKFMFFNTDKGLLRLPLIDCKVSTITSVDNHNSIEINVYPNPVKDIIRLSTNIPLKLELYDIFGNKVLEDTNTQLNVEHLNIGTYYLKYGNETKLIIKY